MTRLFTICAAALLVLVQGHEARAFPPRDPVALSVGVIVNPVEGSPLSACESSEETRGSSTANWWVAVAAEATDGGIRCGSGSFEQADPDSVDGLGTPYLIAQVSTFARSSLRLTENVVELKVSVSLQAESNVSEQSEIKRTLLFFEDRDVFVPLLVPNAAEREASGIEAVFLKVAASVLRTESAAAYGVLSVTSGLQEAELLLDGGVVGTLSAGSETSLRNVLEGLRVVAARDPAGRVLTSVVRVEADRTVRVDLSALEADSKESRFRLAPLGENAQGYEEYRRQADGAVVVAIPAGEFLMGNAETERSPLEHRVYVSDFLMDRTGVTWGQYRGFAAATGTPLPRHEPYWGSHDDHPVVYVTWEDAKAYCEWAGGRLPTEAEREKAARGTDDRKFPWGDEVPDPERAVNRRTWGQEATGAVGKRPAGASPYGLQDMGGNVWEWCSDWYDDGYYTVSPDRDPQGPASGTAHVVRGGSWDSRPSVLSCSARSFGHRGYREGDFGFRCAMHAPR